MRSKGIRLTDAWMLRIPRLLSVFLLIFCLPFVAACSEKSPRWREEVQLSNGSVVRVERMHRYREEGPISGPGLVFPLETRLRVLDTRGKSAEWVGTLDPILLDLDPASGEYILVCSTGLYEVWDRYGRANPAYWEFRLQGNEWKSHPVEPFLFGKPTNLLISPNWVNSTWGLVTLAKKRDWTKEHARGLIDSYRSIDADSRFGIN